MTIQTGLERLLETPPAWIQGKHLGLLCNPASVNRCLEHAAPLIQQRFPGQLRTLFSPQHGFFAEKQDNMIESGHTRDPRTGLKVFSLYGDTRIPTAEMLEDIDILLVDIQDVGTRVYTFIYTLSYCMEIADQMGKQVVVLDRPNPIGGLAVEGNCLNPDYASFVGRFPIPMRHGMTIGEISLLFHRAFGIGAEPGVLTMKGWIRSMLFPDTGLPWVAPSPNMPSPGTALVYPGQVIWEGTNVSEGRGTTQPFEFFGAPYFNPQHLREWLAASDFSGFRLRELAFEPVSGKWQGHLCRGFQIHVTDPNRYRPYETSLRLLQAILNVHPECFLYKPPPYEYDFTHLPMDLIIGDPKIRHSIEQMENIMDIVDSWHPGLEEYLRMRRDCLLYPVT
jgi:uncharacterized protein YbbC (DUF1343 family)